MSITLITGVPGSGKTLKAVWDYLRKDVGHVTVAEDEWGREKRVETKVYTNINGLLLDHDLIEIGGTWAKVGPEWKYDGNPESLRNWHQWAKPGTKIYADEFQKAWPPRPNGSPVPPDVQALDTHRHMGVDFICITQNCRNVDRHLLGLVDRHLHVRRMANMPLAVVYEWDHASISLNYRNSLTKSPWRYPKKAYKLYKSAELHTKQSRKVPGLVWFILVALVALAYLIPTLKGRLTERFSGKPAEISAPAPAAATGPGLPGKTVEVKDGWVHTVETSVSTEVVPAPPPPGPAQVVAAPVLAGCIAVGKRCGCVSTDGLPVDVEPAVCFTRTGQDRGPPVQFVDSQRTVPPGAVSSDYATTFVR